MILFFLKIIYDTPIEERNTNFLRFLKAICTCNTKGVTINQELLYKIFTDFEPLYKAAFMSTRM